VQIVSQQKISNDKRNNHVKSTQCEFKTQHLAKVFTQQMAILRNVAVIKIGNPKIKKNI
jgi:hypothetical protein